MEDVVVNAINIIVGLAIGAVCGYAAAYITGLRAMKKGIQLLLRDKLHRMYAGFRKNGLTEEDQREYHETYLVYESLAENGVMKSQHTDVMKMKVKV